jgi:hypothetical protein
MDALRYVGRDESLPGFEVGRELGDLDEQSIVENGPFFVVLPQAGSVRRLRG